MPSNVSLVIHMLFEKVALCDKIPWKQHEIVHFPCLSNLNYLPKQKAKSCKTDYSHKIHTGTKSNTIYDWILNLW